MRESDMKFIKKQAKKTLRSGVASATLALFMLSGTAYAQKVTVTVQNLTNGSHFTPLLVAVHDSATHLFSAGAVASGSLQAMAEGGDISGLASESHAAGASQVENPAGGLLAPGHGSSTSVINTDGTTNHYLSIVAMILPSNDGFVGLDSWPIPQAAGTYSVDLNAYDAGTEANNELLDVTNAGSPGVLGVPAAPSGRAGTGGSGAATTDHNTKVHIHRGVLGDTDKAGGISDLDSRVHRWLNPVARVTVLVEQ